MIEPLRFSVVVACPPARAFALWTAETARWWPTPHTGTGERGLAVVFEPRVGGRIFERTPAGVEVDWGVVTAWEPPRRLAYSWHIRADRADATDVEIRFIGREGATEVEIEHRGWERLGADGETWRDRNRGGWSTLLPHYIEAAGGGSGVRIWTPGAA